MSTLLERLNTSDRFASGIGAQLVEIREGYARTELTVEERHHTCRDDRTWLPHKEGL